MPKPKPRKKRSMSLTQKNQNKKSEGTSKARDVKREHFHEVAGGSRLPTTLKSM